MWGTRSEGESQKAFESRVLDPKRDDLALSRLKRGKTVWRTEPTWVENRGDDLGLGVKGQSNSVIAGSLRNAFRCSVGDYVRGVELLDA